MKDTNEEKNTSLPMTVEILLHEGSAQGVRSALISGTLCRVTYAPPGRASHIKALVPSVRGSGVVMRRDSDGANGPADFRIVAVHEVRALLPPGGEAVVVMTERELAGGVYLALDRALRGEGPERPRDYHEELGLQLAQTARILLATLQVPGFM